MKLNIQLPKDRWAEHLISNKPLIEFSNTTEKKNWIKDIINEIINSVEAGRIGSAIDFISLGIYSQVEFIDLLRKNGILRHSNYLSSRNPVCGFAKHLLDFQKDFHISSKDVTYLQSLINFESAYEELNNINKEIKSEILKFKQASTVSIKGRKFQCSKAKGLLAFNDMLFLENWEGDRVNCQPSQLEYYSKEEISEGISFLLATYNELIGFNDNDLNFVDANFPLSPSGIKLIVKACTFKAIKELEISIEEFGYSCIKQGANIEIYHSDELFAKSIDLANIQYELQQTTNIFFTNKRTTDALQFRDLAKEFHKLAPNFFQLRPDPVDRYVLLIPPALFQVLLSEKKMTFFSEEINSIQSLSSELLIPFDNLEKYQLHSGLSFYSFIKLLRFFRLIYFLIEPKLKELIDQDNEKMVLSSCVAVFKAEDLKLYLSIIEDKEKVELFLKMISWDTSEKDQVLDLQYKPLILHNDKYLVPPCLAALSNLTRSIFLSEAKTGNNFKVSQMLKHTGIGQRLEQVFKAKGFITAIDRRVKYSTTFQKESDIDFLAYKDGLLLIAECKDTIHPIDLYEMRTTFNHIKKATLQLNHNMAALADSAFRETFLKMLGISANDVKIIQPAIILSNNKFYGHHFDGYPVRNIRETTAFVSYGKWSFGLGDKIITEFSLWNNDELSTDDIRNFFSNSAFHAVAFKCMNPRLASFGKKIHERFYTINLKEWIDELKRNLPFIEKSISTDF